MRGAVGGADGDGLGSLVVVGAGQALLYLNIAGARKAHRMRRLINPATVIEGID